MLRVAPDASTIEHKLTELYPGEIELVEWERCCKCDKEVDVFVYTKSSTIRQGYCYTHYAQ